MITINVRTKEVRLDPDTPVMARNQFGNATYGYVRGWLKPNHPVPAIVYSVEMDYPHGELTIWQEKNPNDPITGFKCCRVFDTHSGIEY